MNAHRNKVFIVSATVAVLAVVLFIVFAFFPPFAYFSGEFCSTNDTEEIITHGLTSDWSLYYLQFFHNLKNLHLYKPREHDLKYIPDTPTLTDLSMAFNEITDMSSVSAFRNVHDLHFFGSHLNFADFGSDSITDLSIWSSYIKNSDRLGSFPNLEHLEIFNCSFVDQDEYPPDIKNGTPEWKLNDSTLLAGLDNVKVLSISRVTVNDISGILDMESLEELQTDSGCFSAEDIETIRDAGINVVLQNEQ